MGKYFQGLPVIYILSSNRTIAAYEKIWSKIISLAKDLPNNITLIHTDFEVAAINVMKTMFPKARIVGCWFHFNQVSLL